MGLESWCSECSWGMVDNVIVGKNHATIHPPRAIGPLLSCLGHWPGDVLDWGKQDHWMNKVDGLEDVFLLSNSGGWLGATSDIPHGVRGMLHSRGIEGRLQSLSEVSESHFDFPFSLWAFHNTTLDWLISHEVRTVDQTIESLFGCGFSLYHSSTGSFVSIQSSICEHQFSLREATVQIQPLEICLARIMKFTWNSLPSYLCKAPDIDKELPCEFRLLLMLR